MAERAVGKAAPLLVAGALLVLAALTGIVLYAVGAPDQAADATALGGLRGALIWGSALAMGVGALLLVFGFIRARRGGRGGLTDRTPDPPPPGA